jgi:Sulfotransferase domain
MKNYLYNVKNWPVSTSVKLLYNLKRKLFYSNRKLIMIASFPKSATNYLDRLLIQSLGFERKKVSAEGGYYHDTIYLPKLIDVMLKKCIVTQHIRPTLLNRPVISELNLRPIVLVRNIYDVVVSYHDHIKRDGIGPLDPDKYKLSPEFCSDFFSFDEKRRYDFIIDSIVPWYIFFYVSWYHYTRTTKEIDAHWIQYENLISEPRKCLDETLEFLGYKIPQAKIEQVVGQDLKVNFNKGIVGRGNQITNEQRDRIKRLAAYHEAVDFGMMGL